MLRMAALSLSILFQAGFTAWGTGALYFSHAQPLVGGVLAGIFAALGLTTIAGVIFARFRRQALGVFFVACAVLLTWWSGIEPSNDRQWKPEVAVAPYATIDGDLVTMHNIRNFDYRSETDFTPAYYDKTFDLRELDAVDLIASYWAGPDIAHIFLSFGFGPDDRLAISIERRDEIGEGYSTLRGLFRQYELFYVVADERDVIRLRTNFRKIEPEEVYLYRSMGPVENGRRLFLDYIREINSLKDKPEFYNTVLTNCTSNIWLHTRVNPGHMAYSWKVLLSGHVPEYLYEQGRLDASLSFPELQERSKINERARSIGADGDYSAAIRAGLPGIPNQ